jgi:hypothetical protein
MRSKKSFFVSLALLGIISILLIGCSGGEAITEPQDELGASAEENAPADEVEIPAGTDTAVPTATNTSVPPTPTNTRTPTPTRTPEPPTATPDPNKIDAGTYLVGTDIRPGIYKGQAGAGLFGSCYWERLKDLSGSFEAILANDNGQGQYYVEVQPTDYAFKTDCDMVLLDPMPTPSAELLQNIPVGTYLIGIEIRPGIYRGQAGIGLGESCYWERLSNVAGGFEGLLANDNSEGQFYVEVIPTDFAFSTDCEMALLDPLPAPPAEFPQTIPVGTYLVGIDISPGNYQGQAGADIMESCYWERLSNVTGGFSGLLANDNATGQFYIQVAPTDFALSTDCELERVGD